MMPLLRSVTFWVVGMADSDQDGKHTPKLSSYSETVIGFPKHGTSQCGHTYKYVKIKLIKLIIIRPSHASVTPSKVLEDL